MRYDISSQQPILDDRAQRDCFTIWERWHPACDSCGRLESAKEKLMSCSYCRVARYCSDKCQKHDWAAGNRHEKVCHLSEVDKKLSDAFIRSKNFRPPVHDPKLSLREKVKRWARLHYYNIQLIMHAVFKDNSDLKKTMHLGVFVKLVGNGPEYDDRSFIIDKLALMPWGEETWSMVKVGFCTLPDDTTTSVDVSAPVESDRTQEAPLPPAFDLHRFITHVNRGITHFHGSYWPLPRALSDAAFAAANPPKEWFLYMGVRWEGFVFVGPDRMGFGVEKRNGAHEPLYRYYVRIWHCRTGEEQLAELAKIDTTEFKKLLDDSKRKVCMVEVPAAEVFAL